MKTIKFENNRTKGTINEEAPKVIGRCLYAGGGHLDAANVYNAGKPEEIARISTAFWKHPSEIPKSHKPGYLNGHPLLQLHCILLPPTFA
ncbi:MAG: hypothetical protein J5I94_24590 [Phaeodactylibacter sp.]|nr:hypothetical protein [Phaeodactylibacter sp.]